METTRIPLCPRGRPRGASRMPLVLAAFLCLSAVPSLAHVYPLHANGVYGQPDYVNMLIPVPTNQRIGSCRGLAATDEGLYISDYGLNRVLFIPKGSTTATRVYGQPSFDTFGINTGGRSAGSLYYPNGVAVNSDGVYVADTYNHRVLRFPHESNVADRVYGQPDFTTATTSYPGYPERSLNLPKSVALDSEGGLYISDTGNHRVVYYAPDAEHPSFVYGKPEGGAVGPGIGPDRLRGPGGIAADDTGVYVVDGGNQRALFFPKGSKTATRLYGQPDYYSILPNGGKMGPGTLMNPLGCAVDEHGLYIVEYLNNRVQFFPGTSTKPSVVYGQQDFNTLGLNQYGHSGYGFYVSSAVATDDEHVYIADHTSRVLRFARHLEPMAADLAFLTAPSSGVAGEGLSSQTVVVVRYADGTPANFSGPVTVRLRPGVGPDIAVLEGETTVNAVNGVATFTNLSVSHPGVYQLQALALSVPVLESEPITIAPAPGAFTGDLTGDGNFDMADIVRHIRIIAGLEAVS